MPTPIQLSFPCSICGYQIRGEYEEEDFDYPVFCPKCGRQNELPSPNKGTAASLSEPASSTDPQVANTSTELPTSIATSALATVKAATVQPKANVPTVVAPMPQTVGSVHRPAEQKASHLPPPVSRSPPLPRRSSRIAWQFRPEPHRRPSVALRNCPAVDDRGHVISAIGNDLIALMPGETDYDIAWKFSAGDLIPGSPVIGNGGVTFAHSSDGLLHALDEDGRPIRIPTRIGSALGWATPLVNDANCVWASAATGGILRVDPSGQLSPRPFLRSPSRFDCTGVLRGNVLYIGSEDQFLHAIDLQGDRGRELWDQRGKVGQTGWYINSAVALADGPRIIAVSRDDCLYAFRPDGVLEWSTPLDGRALGSPVVAPDGTIIVGLTTRSRNADNLSGRLVGIHSSTGQLTWSIDFDAPIESTPVVGDSGEVYVGDNSGKIHAVNPQGHYVWSESVGSAVRSAGTILSIGQVLFGLDDGSLVAVRCDSRQLGAGWPKLLGTAANRCPPT